MSMWHRNNSENGFTLVETTIVLALVAILTLVVILGSGNGIRNERFSGSLREVASNIKEAQTKSYTVRTGSSCSDQDAGPGGNLACFWRGNVLKFDVGGPDTSYDFNLIFGSDLSAASGFSIPTKGLYGLENPPKKYSLNSLTITGIKVGGVSVASVSVAFLAPDGHPYSCDTSHDTNGCTPTRGSNPQPYADSGDIVISFGDASSPHLGSVTIKPSDGTISTIYQ